MLKHSIIISFLLLFSIMGKAQIIDTVCIGTERNYRVYGDSGSVYDWKINGGNIISNPFKDSIQVKWGSISGTYKIYVIESNIYGCKGDTISGNVLVLPHQEITIMGDTFICKGETVVLTATNGTNYHWNTSSTSQSISVSPIVNTNYSVVGTTICGLDTAYHTLIVVPKPQADFSYAPAIPAIGDNINLIYSGTAVTLYNWYDDKNILFSNQMNTTYNIQNQNNTIIYLYVQNQYGCVDSISKTIITDAKINLWVPNSFTPNGDGINDVFKVETNLELHNFNLYIYNRWGQLIFESTDINYGWDGKYMNEYVKSDVYVWILTYTGKYSKLLQRQQGNVSVIK